MFFIERVWTNVEVFICCSCRATSDGQDSGQSHSRSGQKSWCVVLHYLKAAREAIFVWVGDLVLETAHASSVVQHNSILIGFGNRWECIADAVIEVLSFDFSVLVFALTEIVGPHGDRNVRGIPSESWVREGQDIAGALNFVFIAGEEVDAWAASSVCTTLALPALIRSRDDSLRVDRGENTSKSKSSLHYFN